MVSYFKTQWFRLVVALFCLVMCCIYAFKPAPEVLTVEALDEVVSNMVTAGSYFLGFIIWLVMSFINYLQDRTELLEKKAEKYDALCDEVSTLREEVKALCEANRQNEEYAKYLEQKINLT